jgi:hypothetical protein
MNRLLKLAVAAVFVPFTNVGWAGTPDDKNVQPQPTPSQTPPWEITVQGPGWLAKVNGHTGFHGVNPYVNVGFGQIIRHIDAIAAAQAEIRKGRFSVFGSLLYLGAQGGANGSGLVSRVGGGLQEFIGGTALTYRLIDNPRGSLDLLAGFRFTYIGVQTQLSPNVPAIDAASTNLVNQYTAAVATDVAAQLQPRLTALASAVQTLIKQNLSNKLNSVQESLPSIPAPPVAEGVVDQIRDNVAALLQEREQALAAAIRASLENKVAALDAELTNKVNQLKAALSNQISTLVTAKLNRGYSFYDSWADPLIGFRGRLNLNKVFYLTGEVDVGGFGIGSDIAVQAYAALGCNLTRNIFSEVGYRFLYDDFRDESVGYLYQLSTQGFQLTTGIKF